MKKDSMTLHGLLTRTPAPRKGLYPFEVVVLLYALFTLVLMGILHNELYEATDMLLFRARVVILLVAMWAIYRIYPCGLTLFLRMAVQVCFLARWYPDTYEFNRCFANLDYMFAGWEQTIFHCQPSLLLSQWFPSPIVSELLAMGYASFYPLIGVTILFYFFCRTSEFTHAVFVIMTSFFLFYGVFIFLPVTGPTFYFQAVGTDLINQGVFPSIGHYFATHNSLTTDCLPTPGWEDGPMWTIVETAKGIGERPTAAFPSSHVGISVVCLCLLWHSRCRAIFWMVFPFAFLMFFATVYIQAHYAIDALAGLLTGLLFYFLSSSTCLSTWRNVFA